MRFYYKSIICVSSMTILCGCRIFEKTENVICSGSVSGIGVVQTFESKGNIVKSSIEKIIMTTEELGIANTVITDAILDQIVINSYGNYMNINGITINRWLEGNNVIISIAYDFENGDLDKFQQLGILQPGDQKVDLDKTLDSYRNLGFRCQ